MAYDAFEMRVFPILILYIILSIFGIFMTYKMMKKWKERKNLHPLRLSLVFLFFTLAIITLAIGLTEAAITGYYMEIYRISLPTSLSLVIGADISLFLFVSEITGRRKKLLNPLIIIGCIIIVILFLPWNWWGYPDAEYAGKLHIRLYSTLALVIYSYLIYIMAISFSQNAKKIAQDRLTQVGFSLLGYSIISVMFFFVFQIADTIVLAFTDHPGYTIFIYFSWIFIVVFCILIYLSLVMPEWLVKWIERKNESKKV